MDVIMGAMASQITSLAIVYYVIMITNVLWNFSPNPKPGPMKYAYDLGKPYSVVVAQSVTGGFMKYLAHIL